MEKTFTVGRNGYGDPRFIVKVSDDGRVSITEKDPHNGMPMNSLVLNPEDLNALFAELNLK